MLHEAIPHNPVRDLDRIEQPKGQRNTQPRGLTASERRALLDWLDGSSDDPAIFRKQKVARAAELPDLFASPSEPGFVSARPSRRAASTSTSPASRSAPRTGNFSFLS